MRRFLLAVTLVSVLAGMSAVAGESKVGAGQSKTTPVIFKVSLIQEATYRHPHPPDGNPGDVFSTTLRLFAVGSVLGFPDKTPIGTMAFSWTFGDSGVSCSSSAAGCKGTTNITTLTKLPGGTITANGKNVSLAHGLVVPIQSGTGIFKGVTGTIAIAPSGIAQDVFTLNNVKLPS